MSKLSAAILRRLAHKQMLDEDTVQSINKRLKDELEQESQELEAIRSELERRREWYKLF
jgi:hypothetical protein